MVFEEKPPKKFVCVFKNTDQNNICVSLVLEAKTEKIIKKQKLVDPPKRAFLSFEIKTVKKCSSYFSFVLALKIIDAQMFFYQYF